MTWSIEVRHNGLNKYRLIRGQTKEVVEQKAEAQLATWNEMWARKCEVRARAEQREENIQTAQILTEEAEEARNQLTSTLLNATIKNHQLDWEKLKRYDIFSETKPVEPAAKPLPAEPDNTKAPYIYQPNFLMQLFPSLGKSRRTMASRAYDEAREQWQQQKVAIEQENASRAAEFRNLLEKWEAGKASFNETIINFNNSIDTMKSNYFDGEIDSFADYIDNVLGNVELSDRIPGEWQVSYEGETKTAAIEFILPNIDDIPTLKEAKFLASRGAITEIHLKDSTKNALYDDVCYQICLAIIHAVFSSDTAKAVDAAVFNGWVDYIDRGTGKPTRACIMSLH